LAGGNQWRIGQNWPAFNEPRPILPLQLRHRRWPRRLSGAIVAAGMGKLGELPIGRLSLKPGI
jgi:hypothetical protein